MIRIVFSLLLLGASTAAKAVIIFNLTKFIRHRNYSKMRRACFDVEIHSKGKWSRNEISDVGRGIR